MRARSPRTVWLAVAVLVAVVVGGSVAGLWRGPAGSEEAPPVAPEEALGRARARGRALEAAVADLPPPFAEHQGRLTTATYSPDGTRVLTVSRDLEARVWDTEGRLVATLAGHRDRVTAGAFSPDGRQIVTGSADRTARTWAADGTLVAVLAGHEDEITSVAFSPDGDHVLTTALDRTARLWHGDGKEVAVLAPPGGVDSATFAPAGDRLVVLTAGQAVRVFDLAGDERALLERPAGVTGVVASAAGDLLLTWSPERTATAWTLDGRAVATLDGHAASILSGAFSPDGSRIATASLDGTARVWDTSGREHAVLRHQAPVFRVVFAAAGSRVVTVASDRRAQVWEVGGRAVARLGASDAKTRDVVVSGDGRRILTTSLTDPDPRLWDADGQPDVTLPAPGGRVLHAVFAPDGRHLICVGRDLTAALWPLGDLGPVAAKDVESDDGPTRRAMGEEGRARGDYVGAATCAPCHREAYERCRASAHADTFAVAVPANLPEDIRRSRTVDHPPGTTRFFARDELFFAETTGVDGTPQPFPLTHVVGARRIRMLVTRLSDGRLQVLPSMKELPDGAWFDYTHLIFGAPGLDPAAPPVVNAGDASFWTGPVRSFDSRCAACHASGREPREPGPDGTGPRSTWRALGVDCEACHGAGRPHSEAWERMETDAPLPRLQGLDRDGAVQACTVCHMEGDRLTPRFRIGDDLYEHVDPTLAVDPERADPYGRALELIYDGLPFGTSRCAEEGRLVCSTCHAPHGSERRSLLREPLEDGRLCGTCHEEIVRDVETHAHHDPLGPGRSCIACHMPFLTIERGHGAVADHTLGIPHLDLPGDRVAVDACTACHTGARGMPPGAPVLAPEALRAAYEAWWPEAAPRPWMHALATAREGDAEAAERLVEVLRDPASYRLVRASAARLLGRFLPATTDALLDASRDDDSLVRRAAITALAGARGPRVDARLAEAIADPSRAVRIAGARAALEGWERVQENAALLDAALPVLADDAATILDDEMRWFRLGAAYELAGDLDGAIEAYARQTALDPFAHHVRRHLETLRSRRDESGR